MDIVYHGNLRGAPQRHHPNQYGPNKALFLGGVGIGGVPLDSHECMRVCFFHVFFSWEQNYHHYDHSK